MVLNLPHMSIAACDTYVSDLRITYCSFFPYVICMTHDYQYQTIL